MILAAASTGITSGHNTLADILFLVAFILAVIGFVIVLIAQPPDLKWLIAFAIFACIALGWFVL